MLALWLPIVLSAVIVFIASSILHMVLPYHKSDYQKLPDEDKLLPVLRGTGLKRGLYVFPSCTHKEMKSPEMTEKYKQGPVGFMTIFHNGPPAMPKFLGLWFAYCLVVSLIVADLAAHAVYPFETHRHIVRIVGVPAFLAYGLGNIVNSIWKGQTWSMTIKEVIDGLIYAALTAATFAWLWPR
jgi:hypothetical protein